MLRREVHCIADLRSPRTIMFGEHPKNVVVIGAGMLCNIDLYSLKMGTQI